jgi:hypothetical protein
MDHGFTAMHRFPGLGIEDPLAGKFRHHFDGDLSTDRGTDNGILKAKTDAEARRYRCRSCNRDRKRDSR